jgi:glycosyltransferase involved in cell wall biosynthesis
LCAALKEDLAVSAAPRISTIIATHNRPQFLQEALDNLAAQQFLPAEVIVVDDGSGPATQRALERWQARRLPCFELHYFRQRNSGPAVARNRGVAASRGDFIHFMDDDDLMEPDALRHLAAALAGVGGAAVSMASYALLHHGHGTLPQGAATVAPAGGDAAQVLAAMIAGQWFVPIHGYLFTRAASARMGAWDPALGSQEDDEFLFRAALRGVGFIAAPAALVYYRQHDGVRRATPGKPGETVREGLRQRLHDDLVMRESVFRELQSRAAEEDQRAAFQAWHQRLVERYAELLPELEEEAWTVLDWLGVQGLPQPARVPRGDRRVAQQVTLNL